MSTVYHGALDHAELAQAGLSAEMVVDFSSNCNPWGPPPGVLEALHSLTPAAIARYPDRNCETLRSGLATWHGVDASWLCIGNGSAELIWALARALLSPGTLAVVLGPTFGEYAAASVACEARVMAVTAYEESTFVAPDRVEAVSLVWLCNPNNPTGYLWRDAELAMVRARFPKATIVVDEAYLPFVRDDEGVAAGKETVVLRSLTKDFGMAGVRLGYLMAAPEVVTRVQALLPPWSVSAPAQAAGAAALGAVAWRNKTMAEVRATSIEFRQVLSEQGWRLWGGAAPFFLLYAGSGASMRQALLQEGLVVRDCASFGLPEWVRIAPQRPWENRRLVAALGYLKEQGYPVMVPTAPNPSGKRAR